MLSDSVSDTQGHPLVAPTYCNYVIYIYKSYILMMFRVLYHGLEGTAQASPPPGHCVSVRTVQGHKQSSDQAQEMKSFP